MLILWPNEMRKIWSFIFIPTWGLFTVFSIHILFIKNSRTIWYLVTTIWVFEYYLEITNELNIEYKLYYLVSNNLNYSVQLRNDQFTKKSSFQSWSLYAVTSWYGLFRPIRSSLHKTWISHQSYPENKNILQSDDYWVFLACNYPLRVGRCSKMMINVRSKEECNVYV